jgi:hypothetical protein
MVDDSNRKLASKYMPDGVTLKSDYYGNIFINGDMSVKDLSNLRNHSDPNAPTLSAINGWAARFNWHDKRNAKNNVKAASESAIINEIEGRIAQIHQARDPHEYPRVSFDASADALYDDTAPVKHYSALLSDAIRPFFLDSLRDNDLLSLERDIAYTNAVLAKLTKIEALGGSADDWVYLKKCWKEYVRIQAEYAKSDDPALEVMLKAAYQKLSRAIDKPNTADVRSEILKWKDDKRKHVATETARIAAAQEYLNINEAMRLAGDKLGRIMQIIRDENNPALSLKVCSALGLEMD